jgi:hypothetical protein
MPLCNRMPLVYALPVTIERKATTNWRN